MSSRVCAAVLVVAVTAGRVPLAEAQSEVLARVERLSFDRPEVAEGLDVPGNPQGCLAASSDLASLRYIGAAIEAGRQRSGSRLTPHACGLTFSATTGVEYRLNDRLSVSGDVCYTPLTVQRSPNESPGLDGLFVPGRC
jgi:hypothetical protein